MVESLSDQIVKSFYLLVESLIEPPARTESRARGAPGPGQVVRNRPNSRLLISGIWGFLATGIEKTLKKGP